MLKTLRAIEELMAVAIELRGLAAAEPAVASVLSEVNLIIEQNSGLRWIDVCNSDMDLTLKVVQDYASILDRMMAVGDCTGSACVQDARQI